MPRSIVSRVAPLAFVALAVIGAYACKDSTGPSDGNNGRTVRLTVVPVFPSDAAKQIIQFDRYHVVVKRTDGTVALDTTISAASLAALRAAAEGANTQGGAGAVGTGQGAIIVDVPLSPLAPVSGEDFTVDVDMLNASGGLVFDGDPTSVHGTAGGTASVSVQTDFAGTGAEATRVEITPTSTSAVAGAGVDFVGKAFNGATEIPGTPIQWTSLDPTLASVPNALVGHVVAGPGRGTAHIRASLANGPTADATIAVTLPASQLTLQSGNQQTTTVGSALAQSLVVKTSASDGVAVGGVVVTFAVQSGGGSLSLTQITTGADGLASTNYTCSANAGAVVVTATATGLTGSPVSFSATCTAASAAALAFTTQPINAVAGATLAPVVVEARDLAGNRLTSYTGLITLALETTPAGVQLQGTLSANAVAGVATFSALTVSNAAVGLRFVATGVGAATGATSALFTITPRPAVSLAFTTQPVNVGALDPMQPVVVAARDALGNVVTNYTGLITLTLDSPPAGVGLQGVTSTTAVNGVAIFSTLAVSAQAASVRLSATGVGITGAFLSNSFVVGPPTNPLVANPSAGTFTVQRTAASPAPLVVALTSQAAQVTGMVVGTITYGPGATGWLAAGLGAATTPTNLTLTATTPALPAGTFTANVPINAANGISLLYTVTLNVTPLPVTQIVMFTQPAGATSGLNFVTQPVVELRDATGTIVLSATNVVTASVNTGTGVLSGTLARAPVNGRVTFNDLKITGTGAHTLAFNSGILTGATSASFNVGAALSTTQAVPTTTGTSGTLIPTFTPVTAAGGTPAYTFALSGGVLPTGMNFNTTTGTISGTPTTALATTTFTVTVTDAVGTQSSKTFQLTVNLGLTTTQAVASVTGTVNTLIPTVTPVTATGGTAPLGFALSGGALPTGMSFNTTNGQLSGTPTTTLATTTFTVTVTDATLTTSFKTFNLTVNPALTTTQAVATTAGTNGTLIPTFTPVTASGGTLAYTFALSGGALPTGMSFSTTTGAVSGTPTAVLATTTFTVTVTDAAGATSFKTFQLTVNASLTTTQAVPSTTGTSGTLLPTFTPVTAAGGTVPLTFVLSGGALPSGLSFNTTNGQVSGTPTAAIVTTTYTVTVTDNAGASSFKTFQLTVNGPLSTTQAVPTKVGTVGAAIASFIPVVPGGGTTPYSFALTGGTLPTGLSFSTTTGAIVGTPTTVLATTTFTVTVTDATLTPSAKTFDLTVNPALTTTQAVPTTAGTVNTLIPTFTPVTASAGTVPYTFALSGGALPTGMSFSTTTGAVSGTPTTTLATTTFTVTATDNAGATSFKTFQLTVNAALTTTQAVATKVGTSGTLIATFTPVTAAGGTLPYTFALSGGALPTGMAFSTTNGQVSGTPTSTLAVTTFTVTVTDNAGASSFKTFQLTVNTALTTTQAVAAVAGTVNTLIPSFTPVTASGGTAPNTFVLSGGALPTGMTFNTGTGLVSGTPTTTLAITTFTVTVTDAAGATSFKTFQLTVNSALTTTQAVPAITGNSGSAIATTTPVTAAGGTVPYTFALSGGTLPTGLNFDTTNGQLSGTPTTTIATTTFTVTVTDNAGAISSKTFNLTVNGPLSTTQAVATKAGTVNTLIPTFTPVTASGGTTPYSFALSGGSLPTGMSFSTTTGAVSGTPTTTLATTTFTVTVTDAALQTSFKTFQLTVNSALTTTQAVPTTTGTVNTLIPTFTPVTASGGTVAYTFALSGGTLPTGMSFSTTTGAVSGTPSTTLATTTFTVTVTDAATATSFKTFQLTVNSALTTTVAVAAITANSGTAIATTTPVTAAGGTTPYTFALSGGTLPTGLNFSTTNGQLSGTPTTTLATTAFTVTVTDNAGASSAKNFNLTVNTALSTTQAVPSTVGTSGQLIPTFTPVTASGGTTPYVFALSGGTLPTGMSFSTTTGAVSGTPTTTLATTTFTVTVTDNIGAVSAKTFDLKVNTALTTTQAVPSTTGSQGTLIPTFTPVTAAGGTIPLVFALSGGSLPTGMSFNTTNGQVSGTPSTSLALTTFTVTVTDAANATSFKTFQLTVNGPLAANQTVPSTVLQIGNAVTPFTPVTASGGTAPYTYAITSGTLPTGLNFSTTTGQITGTPTAMLVPTATFTVQVTDNVSATASNTFDLKVNGIVLAITASATPSVLVNTDFAVPINVDMSNRGTADLGSMAITVNWDPARFSFVNQTSGNGAGWSVGAINTANTASGQISISGFATTGLTADFVLHNLTLHSLTTGAATPITVTIGSSGNEGGQAIIVTPRNASVTITP